MVLDLPGEVMTQTQNEALTMLGEQSGKGVH